MRIRILNPQAQTENKPCMWWMTNTIDNVHTLTTCISYRTHLRMHRRDPSGTSSVSLERTAPSSAPAATKTMRRLIAT